MDEKTYTVELTQFEILLLMKAAGDAFASGEMSGDDYFRMGGKVGEAINRD